MDPSPLLFVAFVAFMIFVAWYGWQQDRRRVEQLRGFALSRGWSYTPEDPSLVHRFPGPPFGRGERPRARHVLRGTFEGHDVVTFDYTFQTSTTDSKGHRRTTTHRYRVAALPLPAPVPRLTLTTENVLTRIGNALGAGDVELESEDFNRRYRVNCDDPRFAYDVLHPRTMQALLARPSVNLRLGPDGAVSWGQGAQQPADLLLRLSTLALVVEGVPSWVWRDRTDPRGASS